MKKTFSITVILFLISILFTSTTFAALTQTQVSQLYVSIFGRASEGEGSEFWVARGKTMALTATEMLGSPAAIEYFGTSLNTDQAFIEHIYSNTLGKTLQDDEG